MRSWQYRLVSASLILTMLTSLVGCTSQEETKPTHKKATSICLVKPVKDATGTPTKELAANLIEAQVVFGVRAKLIEITPNESVSNRLLRALQDGCVLMASAEPAYLDNLASFARNHSKMMVFFVGGKLAEVDQPGNFRWFKDDLALAAKLAGFHAAELGENISLLIQPGFANSTALGKAIAEGVREFEKVSGQNRTLETQTVASSKALTANLQLQPKPEIVIMLAGASYWKLAADFVDLQFIGADLQFGQTAKPAAKNIVGSIERGTSIHLLRTVSALLDRDFSNQPPTRSESSLTDELVQFRLLTDPSGPYNDYLQKLENQQ